MVIQCVPSSRCRGLNRTSAAPQLLLLFAHLSDVDLAPEVKEVASEIQLGLTQFEGMAHVFSELFRMLSQVASGVTSGDPTMVNVVVTASQAVESFQLYVAGRLQP